jgi:hypothetical protein
MNASVFSARRSLALLGSLLLVSVALVVGMSSHGRAAAAASNNTYPPTQGCALSSTNAAAPGANVSVTGSGYPDNGVVTLSVQPNHRMGSVQTDDTGSFTDTITIPASLRTGSQQVVASSGSESCSIGLRYGVSGLSANQTTNRTTNQANNASSAPVSGSSNTNTPAAASGSNSGGSNSGALAFTGFPALTAMAVATALLAGGLLFVMLGRRRKEQ